MPYLYLCFSVLFIASASVLGAFYNRRAADRKGSGALYNFVQLSCEFLIWAIVFAFQFSFDWRVLIYSLLFGAFFTVCRIGTINALKTGPVALTSLFMQLSLIFATVWGFIFWDAAVTVFAIVGLVLVVVSLFLCLYKGKRSNGEKMNLKWLFFAVLMLFGNAGCTIVQRMQQTAFQGQHGALLMLGAMTISLIANFVIYVTGDKSETKIILKKSWCFPVAAGACNVALNLFVMLLAVSSLSPSLIYPVISIGGLIVSILFSVLVFKEKLRWWQWVGVALGCVSVGILSV